MTIDDYLKLVQILFYITGGTVALLTFVSAKKGLLNPINTEYHKIAFVKIKELSEILLSEFDPKSENYWAKDDPLEKYFKEVHEIFEKNKEQILKSKEFPMGRPTPRAFDRLADIIREIKSEPFLPSEIREIVVKHLESRTEMSFSIQMEELDKYFKELVNGKYQGDLKYNYAIVHNRINDRMYKNGCGISQVEEQIHEVRLAIQKYLKKYDPLK
jgi:hypothetical protein